MTSNAAFYGFSSLFATTLAEDAQRVRHMMCNHASLTPKVVHAAKSLGIADPQVVVDDSDPLLYAQTLIVHVDGGDTDARILAGRFAALCTTARHVVIVYGADKHLLWYADGCSTSADAHPFFAEAVRRVVVVT